MQTNDDGSEKILWTNLTIHHMKRIYKELVLKNFLNNTVDVRKAYLNKLSVTQLRNECAKEGLDSSGLKVSFKELFQQYKVLIHIN